VSIFAGGDFASGSNLSTLGGDFIIDSPGSVAITEPVLTGGGAISISGADIIVAGVPLDAGNPDGTGGSIGLTARTSDISASDVLSAGVSGGAVTVSAITGITTDTIDTRATVGNGGNVTLDPTGDIRVVSINAQGGTAGRGGSVDITTDQFFRATGSFVDRDGLPASISTAGASGGGDITIRHGGQGEPPFIVGGAATNGTAASISSGTSTIAPVRTFPFSFTEGNIRIIGIDEPPSSVVNPIETIPAPPPEVKAPEDPALSLPLEVEEAFTHEYEDYLGIPPRPIKTLDEVRKELRKIEAATGVKPAVIYAMFMPVSVASHSGTGRAIQSMDLLELILVTSRGIPSRRDVADATRGKVKKALQRFRSLILARKPRGQYLPQAQQLYQWLVAPLEEDLQTHQIDHIVFVMDANLRSLPVAALHDGQGFIVRKYSVGLMPSLSLTDTRYVGVKDLGVLALGATEFSDQPSLPGVQIELNTIAELWQGTSLLNEEFTQMNLLNSRASKPYGILHLATHANFRAGNIGNSYIQLWDDKLSLDQIRQLKLHDPPLELLTLSACRTALGDRDSELGFTGIAAHAGVKSAVGSLWKVDDKATLGLMISFYGKLREPDIKIKATALQQAQVTMIDGKVRQANDYLETDIGRFRLPEELAQVGVSEFRHPFYWSGFTIIGSPW
jgi:CHAT domain-containing protein